jgi:hypothetical protein
MKKTLTSYEMARLGFAAGTLFGSGCHKDPVVLGLCLDSFLGATASKGGDIAFAFTGELREKLDRVRGLPPLEFKNDADLAEVARCVASIETLLGLPPCERSKRYAVDSWKAAQQEWDEAYRARSAEKEPA